MKTLKYITLLVLGALVASCTQDDIILEDHFIDYEIPEIPVEEDYTVGAHYSRFEFTNSITKVPTVGIYDATIGEPSVYEQHVSQAQTAGINYFVFDLRSNYDPIAFSEDSSFMANIFQASNAGEINFAISYNFGPMELSDNNRIEDAGLVAAFLEDFNRMLPFFQQSNYMQVDGQSVLYMANSHNLFSNDNAALYQQLRDQMSGQGIDLFIIGEQNEWTPPLRYDFRFQNGVDAVTHRTYANINVGYHDRYLFWHNVIDQAWTYHNEKFSDIGIEYVPTISPSFDPTINNPGSNNIVIEKDQEWFELTCNVARKTTGEHNLILVDSFNDWNRDTQLESAESYSDTFLNILREEFKTN